MKKTNIRNYVFYMLGLLGHDVFYFAFSLYLIKFVTGPLFNSADDAYNRKMVATVSAIIVIVRIAELVLDPFLGAIVDNTKTKIGKFKPWIIIGALCCSLSFVLLFTTLGGTNISNPGLYLFLFAILFLFMDCTYSLYDISIWSMIPAISETYEERNLVGTIARLGAGIGQLILTVMVMPSVLLGEHMFGTEQHGWLFFALLVFGFGIFSILTTCLGVKENDSPLRQTTEKTKFKDVFKIIFRNDQLAWLAVSNWCYYFALALVSTLMTYYFQYIYGNATSYSTIFGPATIAVIVSILFYPWLTKRFSRKQVLFGALIVMLSSFALFQFAGDNIAIIIVCSVLFLLPQPIIWASFLLALTDTVEYGQWKMGRRNESLTLAVRPLLDKFAGALSNGTVGLVAIVCGMTGAATVNDITSGNKVLFKIIMFGVPALLILISMFIYHRKFKLTAEYHQKIVDEIMAGKTKEQES